MADLKISEMASAAQINNSDNIELSQGDSVNGFVSLKTNILALAQKIATAINFTSDLQTVNKTLTGAINEAAASGGTDTIAEDFDDTATYTVGEYCIYGGKLYKCTTAVSTAGAWDANDWTETLVMDEVSSGGGGGTTVIANPSGTPTDELETIQIGNDIYEVVGGGGGGSAEWTDVVGTLEAGDTEIVLTSSKIKTTSAVFPWTDKFGVAPTNMVVANGSVTLTFPVQSTDLGVMVRISKVGEVHVYSIPLDRLDIGKVWFYWDTAYVTPQEGVDELILSKTDYTPSSWTAFGAIGIDLNQFTIPSNLTKIKVHFNRLQLIEYAAVRFMNSATLFSGGQSGNDAMLNTNGFYQYMGDGTTTIDEEDFYLEIPCTVSDLTNQYLYIMASDGMIPETTTGYRNDYEGKFLVKIDGIDFITGGN